MVYGKDFKRKSSKEERRENKTNKKKVMLVHVIWECFKQMRKKRKEGKSGKNIFYNYYLLLKMNAFMRWTKNIYIFHNLYV